MFFLNDRPAFRSARESEAGMLHVNIPTLGGEAQAARDAFAALSSDDRRRLVEFVNSL